MPLAYFCHHQLAWTPDISQLIFSPVSKKLSFIAGQYVEIILSSGKRLSLSIANAPQANGHLEFHVRHNTAHPLAQQWLKELQQNKIVFFHGPQGQCTLQRAQAHQNLVFIAGGTGFALIKALLESAFPTQRPLRLYWGIRQLQDIYCKKLLLEWQKHGQFSYTLVLSNKLFSDWRGARGWVHEYFAHHHIHHAHDCIFASGPFAMIQALQSVVKKPLISDMI